MKPNALLARLASLLSLLFLLSTAHAHEGHGLEGSSHYHATDVWGFVVMHFLMAVVWWFTGRGK